LRQYTAAVMSELPERNGWSIARHAGDKTPDRTQRLLNHASWDTLAAMGVVRRFAVAGLEDLHVLTLVTTMQGRLTDALPLFDRALAVTESDPALTDLRLLLQINQAVTLGNLDRYEEALAAARPARDLADQVGTAIRLAQAHGALGQLLFETGRWDDALAEMQSLPENLKEPGAACCDLGIAAVISFHRGETGTARRHLAAAVPHAERLGHRFIGRLALARSLDHEHDGALPEALAALADGFDGKTEELEEVEDLLADGVRLAVQSGDLVTAQALARHAEALAAESQIPLGGRTCCTAAACWTATPPGCWPPPNVMTRPAGRC
jgi:tetratricopeptide (TPR) repeat protein